MNGFRHFLPITKVDAVNQLVYCTFTEEVPDRSKEILDYDTSAPFFKAWSDGLAKTTGGKNLGNVREMHQPTVAAGQVTEMNLDDLTKRIHGCIKVTDDAAWKKVEAGTYTGVSIGGSYIKRWNDPNNIALKRYTADPMEISLVDLPCLPTATFELIKRAPVTVEHKNATGEVESTSVEEQIVTTTEHFSKVSDTPPPYSELDPDLAQVWQARDGKSFAKKADAVAYNEELDAADLLKSQEALTTAVKTLSTDALGLMNQIAAALSKKDGGAETVIEIPEGTTSGVSKATPSPTLQSVSSPAFVMKAHLKAELKKAAEGSSSETVSAILAKGLYTVGRVADLLMELSWLKSDCEWEEQWETAVEGETPSSLPNMFATVVDQLCTLLRQMVVEETSELMSGLDVEVIDSFAMSAVPGMAGLLMAKTLMAMTEEEKKVEAPEYLVKLTRMAKLAKGMDPTAAKYIQKAHNSLSKMSTGLTCTGADTVAKKAASASNPMFDNLQQAHDCICAMGASCEAGDAAGTDDSEDMEKLAKVFGFSDVGVLKEGLSKVAVVMTENEILTKTLNDMKPGMEALLKRVKTLEDQPLPGKGVTKTFSVSKQADGVIDEPGALAGGKIMSSDDLVNQLEKSGLSQDEVNKAMMKLALRNGRSVGG
jgi:hypothetical protein